MKRVCLFLLLACFVGALAVSADEAKKENIAIISTKAVDDDWGTLATGEGYLVDFFFKMKRFNVIERSLMQQIMKEQAVQQSGAIDEATAVKLGGLAGAQYLVMFSVTSVPQPFSMGGGNAAGMGAAASMMGNMKMKMMMGTPAISVNVRIVGVADGKIIFNKNASR
jgi:curli biogenesis system outer membrane secretion channel CsgG